jgi:ubiquinone biosynthesis protein
LLLSFYRQLFEDNLFHGDLHPGNIMLLRNSKFALIDLGTVGNLEPRFVANYRKQAEALASREYSKAADLFLLLSDNLPLLDINAFRQDVIAAYRSWEARTKMRGLSYLEKSITGGVAGQVSEIARKYKVNPSWQFLRVTRALGTLDVNLNSLLGNVNPVNLIKSYSRQANMRNLKRTVKNGFASLSKTVRDISEAATYATDTLRRQSIQFEGARSSTSRIAHKVLGWVRVGLFLGLIVIGYDLLQGHAFGLISTIHPYMGSLAAVADAIPTYALDLGIGAIALVILLIWLISRVRSISSEKTLRLPNGRLDT